jgi:hypothetical protein
MSEHQDESVGYGLIGSPKATEVMTNRNPEIY